MKRYNWEYNGETMGLVERNNGICVLHSDVVELTAEVERLKKENIRLENHIQTTGVKDANENQRLRELLSRFYVITHEHHEFVCYESLLAQTLQALEGEGGGMCQLCGCQADPNNYRAVSSLQERLEKAEAERDEARKLTVLRGDMLHEMAHENLQLRELIEEITNNPLAMPPTGSWYDRAEDILTSTPNTEAMSKLLEAVKHEVKAHEYTKSTHPCGCRLCQAAKEVKL